MGNIGRHRQGLEYKARHKQGQEYIAKHRQDKVWEKTVKLDLEYIAINTGKAWNIRYRYSETQTGLENSALCISVVPVM
jgi:hypothetical protein